MRVYETPRGRLFGGTGCCNVYVRPNPGLCDIHALLKPSNIDVMTMDGETIAASDPTGQNFNYCPYFRR